MTKKDLKNGDWVEFANGKKRMVLINEVLNDSIFTDNVGYMPFRRYKDDLSSVDDIFIRGCYDIMKVWRSKVFNCFVSDGSFINDDTLIWERKETREMTLKEVCKELGYNVKIVKK